jgi:hypothetical protein
MLRMIFVVLITASVCCRAFVLILPPRISLQSLSSSKSSSTTSLWTVERDEDFDSNNNIVGKQQLKSRLLTLLAEVPPNESTSIELTRQILHAANTLEAHCSSTQIEEDSILPRLAGNWELLWTAQDLSNLQKNNNPFLTFINPLENQSYSNNPRSRANADNASGRSNPILPLVSIYM